MADQVAHLAHLNARDTTLVFVSRAPQADIERWKARMGWEIPWYTITDDFDADFGVDEWHGTNAFIRDGDGDLPHLLHRQPRRRGDGQHLEPTSTSPRSGARRSGRTRRRATRRPPPYEWWNLHDEYDSDRVIAHVGGVPLEELLPSLAGAGAGLLVARAWLALHLRRRREPGHDDGQRRCASSAPSRRPPRRSSTRGPARR